jgi:hypothetical protein
MARFRLAGRSFDLAQKDFEDAVKGIEPGPIYKYAVTIGRRRFAPKDVVARATRVGPAEFTTQEALRVLRSVGVVAEQLEAGEMHAKGPRKIRSQRKPE